MGVPLETERRRPRYMLSLAKPSAGVMKWNEEEGEEEEEEEEEEPKSKKRKNEEKDPKRCYGPLDMDSDDESEWAECCREPIYSKWN